MAKFTVEHNENYSLIANIVFKDKRLSWKAKGLLANMLSLANDWDYSLAGLVTLSSDGETATRTALKELENFGYLIRQPIRERGKIIDWDYSIFEKPQVEKPVVENPQVENRTQLNTKQSITKQSNTNIIKDIVEYLNKQLGTTFKPTTQLTQRHINARLQEGFTLDDFKQVIDNQIKEWKGDAKMEKYLRPETLFGTKFESYLVDSERNRKSYNKKKPTESGINIGVTIL